MRAITYCLWIFYTFSIHPFKLFPHFKYRRFILKTCTYLFVLQIRPTGNSYFRFQKWWGTDNHEFCSDENAKTDKQQQQVKYLKGKTQIRSFLLEKQPRDRSSWKYECEIDASFMTLELYYNTELGAVIDRNKDTRCIAICIAIRFSISQYALWRIVAPLFSGGDLNSFWDIKPFMKWTR